MTKDQQSLALGAADDQAIFAPSIRDDAPIRQAARLVIEEMGPNAGKYAVWRARALERQGDPVGASAWRRVAPVIQALERERQRGRNVTVDRSETQHSELE
jgi:hypothetical protein